MPVLGHAAAGLATAAWAARRGAGNVPGAMELPLILALAYAPDIAAWSAEPLWGAEARRAAHSLLVAPLAAVALGALLARPLGGWRRAFALALASLGLHDALDLLQGTDRAPAWPLPLRETGVAALPSGLFAEAVAFGLALAVLLGLTRGGWRAALEAARPPGRALAAGVVLAAALTHQLRERREAQFAAAQRAFAASDHRRVLDLLAAAERWPSTARPGRIDTLRADALAALGDRSRAERLYLAALAADPSYFWAAAGLAILRARGDAPVEQRRRRAAADGERLQHDFRGHPELPAALAAMDAALR
jgi:tetratricopeptide (TPR) repeat protein